MCPTLWVLYAFPWWVGRRKSRGARFRVECFLPSFAVGRGSGNMVGLTGMLVAGAVADVSGFCWTLCGCTGVIGARKGSTSLVRMFYGGESGA